MSDIKSAVKFLVGSFADINAQAKTWKFDLKDVEAELKKAKPDTAEYVVLNLLKNGANGIAPTPPVQSEPTEPTPIEPTTDATNTDQSEV